MPHSDPLLPDTLYRPSQTDINETPGGRPPLLHPANPNFKYVVLFVNCMLTFGSYFCFDMPSTMKEELQTQYIEPWAPDNVGRVIEPWAPDNVASSVY